MKNRRSFLLGAGAFFGVFMAAPSLVRASSIMPVSSDIVTIPVGWYTPFVKNGRTWLQSGIYEIAMGEPVAFEKPMIPDFANHLFIRNETTSRFAMGQRLGGRFLGVLKRDDIVPGANGVNV